MLSKGTDPSTKVCYDPTYIKEVLTKLGFNNIITDNRYFRAPAIYRKGSSLAFSIDKKTGNWRDFKTKQWGTLKELPLLFGANGANILIKEGEVFTDVKPEIEQEERFWEPTILNKLLPIYEFYKTKRISEKTLRLFKGGVAKRGDLANRFVFPIFHKYGKIHGFSGRNLKQDDGTNKYYIKWKHIGKSGSFIYPYYTVAGCKESIVEKDCVYLTESIGDTLSLWENGYQNSLVCFGTSISQAIINTLISLNPSKIYLSPNNESSGRGNKAAINWYLKLSSFFPLEQIEIKWTPKDKDFGDCTAADLKEWENTAVNTKAIVIDHLTSKIKKGYDLNSREEAVYQTLC